MTSENLLREINGVIWPGFLGTSLPDWLREALADGLAGVVYFRQNIESFAQIAEVSQEISALNPGAIIGVDEEGGNVTRLQVGGGSEVPGAAVLGRLDDEVLTEAAGARIGMLCRQAGINMTIAPVADVNTNPMNPVIGVRSFGAETDLVSRHTAAMVRGIQSTGIAACAKHFPGHGDTQTDSHLGLPRLDFDLATLVAEHLPPFQAAADAGVKAIMTAHIVLSDLGDEPATINPTALAMLRNTGFDGALVTDALDMAAIRSTVGSGQGAVQAILAGADLLCIGNPDNPRDAAAGQPDEQHDLADYLEVRDALLAAVESGLLPRERLTEAYRRNQRLAASLSADADAGQVSEPDWLAAAVRACAGDAKLPDAVVASGKLTIRDLRESANLAVGQADDFFSAAFAEQFELVHAANPDLAIVDAIGADQPSRQAAELAKLSAANPDLVCLNAGLVPKLCAVPTLTTFGSSRVSARAAVQRLTGQQLAKQQAEQQLAQ